MSAIDVSASIGALIVHAAAGRGVGAATLCAATGFDPRLAEDPDARIPLVVETALWDAAARLADDPAIGLHAAESLRPGVFDVLDYVVRTAPTLRVSLERLARYNRLLHDSAVFTVSDRGPVTRVEHAPGTAQSRHAAEFTLASLVVIGGQIAGTGLDVRGVELRHAPVPEALPELARVFGRAPLFGRPVNALDLDAAQLARPSPAADPVLSRVVLRHADALLAARPAPAASTADRVRHLLAQAMGEGEATLVAVAAKLRMSERSLQRRLADEGSKFDALLDETRRDLALRYLADRKVAIAEVAYLLGYSEPSAFHRAFKRWTGLTPSEVRRAA